jgi:Rrf2 family protein
MRLTRGCGYALRALEYLAARRDGRPATARDIAAARRAPRRFLLRPLKALVTAGLLRSMPGSGGGYRLGRPAARITLLEVVEAVDGPIRGEAPPAQAAWAGLDSRLGAACGGVAGLVRRRLVAVRLSGLFGR